MKIKFMISLSISLVLLFLASCASTGQLMPMASDENVIGTIQTTFTARDTWLVKNKSINTQAYIKLLEAAVQKYPGNIDIRDIVWVTGRTMGPGNTEVSATAKVIGVNNNEI